jgi:hypothetical protein
MIILLPFRAFSVNEQFCKDKKFGMRKDAKEFCYKVNWELQKYKDAFDKLRSEYNPKKHGISVSFTHNYKDFYTISGEISHKLLDLTNTEKLLMDLCIDKAHNGPAPYKSPNLNLNDKSVIELISVKRPSTTDHVIIEITLLDLDLGMLPE